MGAVSGYLTNFPNGVTSFGIPMVGSSDFYHANGKKHWWVNSVVTQVQDGTSPASPFATMAQAFAVVGSGDCIHFNGNVREQLVTPVGIFDVTVIGEGNRPRHADAHTGNNGYTAATWRAPAAGAVVGQANVRVIQQGWRFVNILWAAGDSTAAMIEIVRNAGAGDAERDGSHCSIYGCRFSGAGVGVRSGVAGLFTEIAFNVEIAGNKFNACTTGISGINGNSWSIHDNEFQGCTSVITLACQNSFIYNNVLTGFTAAANSGGIDLNGGGGLNIVTKNYLSGTYSNAGGYRVSNANDEWAGNFNTLAGGITVADPA
jgi:hypothetical protein